MGNSQEINEYNVKVYSDSNKFLEDFSLQKNDKKAICIIFLATTLGVDNNNEQITAIDILRKIKGINSRVEVILYSNNDEIDLVSDAFTNGVYTFIKKNENIVLRIENNVRAIISQKIFLIKKQSSRLITIVFLLFLLGISTILRILCVIYPEYGIF